VRIRRLLRHISLRLKWWGAIAPEVAFDYAWETVNESQYLIVGEAPSGRNALSYGAYQCSPSGSLVEVHRREIEYGRCGMGTCEFGAEVVGAALLAGRVVMGAADSYEYVDLRPLVASLEKTKQ
jgi:hypothetical protein